MYINNSNDATYYSLLGLDDNEEDTPSIPERGNSYKDIPRTFHGMPTCYRLNDLPKHERGQYEGYTAQAVKTYNALSDYCLKPTLSMDEAHHMAKLVQHYDSTISAAREHNEPQADAAYAKLETKIRTVSGFLKITLNHPQDTKVIQKTHYCANVSHVDKATAAYDELTARWGKPISSPRDIEYLEGLIKTYKSEIFLAIEHEAGGVSASKKMGDRVSAISTALVHMKYKDLSESMKITTYPERKPVSPFSNRNDYPSSPASSITTIDEVYLSPKQRPSISTHDMSTETINLPSPPRERRVSTRDFSTNTVAYEPAPAKPKQNLELPPIPACAVTQGMNSKTKAGIEAYNKLSRGEETEAQCVYECANAYHRNMRDSFQGGEWINERVRLRDKGVRNNYEYIASKPESTNYWKAHYATCDHMCRMVESAAGQVTDVVLQYRYVELLEDLRKYRNEAGQFYITNLGKY